MAAKRAQLAKRAEGEEAAPTGPSEFQKQRAEKRRQNELLEAMEEVDDSLLALIEEEETVLETPETEDETNQRRRIDEALAGFGQ